MTVVNFPSSSQTPQANLGPRVAVLAALALHLARRRGRRRTVSGYPMTVVELDDVEFIVSNLGQHTQVEVWDQITRHAIKVFTARWNADDDEWLLAALHQTCDDSSVIDIDIISFRRGAWEEVLITTARRDLITMH